MKQEQFDRVVAGLATVIILALIFLWLFLGSLRWDSLALTHTAQANQPPEEEEFFIEPEILEDKGEEDAPEIADQQEAPAEQGEPEKAETESDKTIVRGENPNPAPQREKPVVQKQPSPVKAVEPPKTDKKESKVSSKMAKGFSGKNGKAGGKAGGFGTGGTGTASVKGVSRGRQMLSCPKPSVALKNKVTITVTISVREDGTVASAKASGGAERYLLKACEDAARKSKWTPKVGAGTVSGTITFTITPKV